MLGDIATASQQTLKTVIGCRGIGLHSGQRVAMTLHPAPPDTGIVFRRTGSAAEIRANWVNTIESPLCTVLSDGEGIRIGTVEHIMAALAGAEIDNAIVELDGSEVPIMDGSSAPFLFLIECAGIVEQDVARRAIKVLKPVSIVEDGASAALFPDDGFTMSFEIDFENPVICRQELLIVIVIVAVGVIVGLIVAFGVGHLMGDFLIGVSPVDALTDAGGSILLTLVALAACYVPARRATRVDPMVALR